MGKKLISFLVSTRLTAFLFIVYAFAMAIGTFIENDYGTVTAKILIYNATWFELILVVFVINFPYKGCFTLRLTTTVTVLSILSLTTNPKKSLTLLFINYEPIRYFSVKIVEIRAISRLILIK